nr:MAG TPA_asm: hypothetical protein [Caudoviricetes sp.]
MASRLKTAPQMLCYNISIGHSLQVILCHFPP